jgi:hypothetical protein
MSMKRCTAAHRLGAALALCALTIPVAGAQARYDQIPQSSSASGQDLRSPDARDAAGVGAPAVAVVQAQDLRSPDARDAGTGYSPPAAVPVAAPIEVRAPDSGGFDWPSAAIGAGILALVLLVAGAGVATVRRRADALS